MGGFPWLHALMREELVEGIDRQKLDARACIEHVARNACEDPLHHALGTRVAVVEGDTLQEAASIYQAIIDGPGIDTNTVECSCYPARFAQSCEGFVPQRQDIPEAMFAQRHQPVGKAMYLFQAQVPPIEARQHHPSALGTQIDGCNIACLHKPSPLTQRG